jgi:ABC-type multidrug transport system ATPase subunit
MFAAELKLPESISQADKAARVADVLDQLGLTSVAETRIGSGERRGISGGERRRLSIGLELMAQPSVLILDEPTSGAHQSGAIVSPR